MNINSPNRQSRIFAIIMLVAFMTAVSISAVDVFSQADCDDECQNDTDACCLCICCSNNVVMTFTENHSVQFEYLACLWTLARTGAAGEQEWFTNIDRPPQILS